MFWNWVLLSQGYSYNPILLNLVVQKFGPHYGRAIMVELENFSYVRVIASSEQPRGSWLEISFVSQTVTEELPVISNLTSPCLQGRFLKIQREYLLIPRFFSYTRKLWPRKSKKKNWFASEFYFQRLPRDVNWLRPHLKLTTRELKPLSGATKWDPN